MVLSGRSWFLGHMGNDGDFIDVEPTVEGILSLWGMEPIKHNLALVSLLAQSHSNKGELDKLRWNPVDGLASLGGDIKPTLVPMVSVSLNTVALPVTKGFLGDRCNLIPSSGKGKKNRSLRPLFRSGGLEDVVLGVRGVSSMGSGPISEFEVHLFPEIKYGISLC